MKGGVEGKIGRGQQGGGGGNEEGEMGRGQQGGGGEGETLRGMTGRAMMGRGRWGGAKREGEERGGASTSNAWVERGNSFFVILFTRATPGTPASLY